MVSIDHSRPEPPVLHRRFQHQVFKEPAMTKSSAAILLLAPILFVCGCGGMPNPLSTPIEIRGHVAMPNGAALTRGSVAFFPIEEAKGSETFGMLNSDGTYSARIIPGKYRVAIEPEWVRAATRPGSTQIPKRFWDPNSSKLEIEVTAANAENVSFSLN